ncbi:hypothetical protein [Nesterenkonia pannonica]|uniref:hypothetical protein n=1 Tax=Nesterenkonia pannonica TaxID=1548602 RepID=UPI002164177D|nr:hypothetical protein [Nesterenkonia pannonica]
MVTGSPMPEGALSVLREEHSAYDEGASILTAEAHTPDLDAGRNIRPRGWRPRRGPAALGRFAHHARSRRGGGSR